MSSFFRSRFIPFLATLFLATTPLLTQAALTPENTGLKAAAPSGLLVNACAGSSNCLAVMAGKVIDVALGFLGVLLVGLFLWGGFMWMTAGGEKEKVQKAQGIIANAVAGIFIVAISFAATSYVLTKLDEVSTADSGTGGLITTPP